MKARERKQSALRNASSTTPHALSSAQFRRQCDEAQTTCLRACQNEIKTECFAKDSTTACLLSSPNAECHHVLMADLIPGDLVLGRDGATTVVAVQHKAVDTVAMMLTFHTADGAVSMTPDHAVFVDGILVAAADARIGSVLSTGAAIERITKGKANIINPVTASGTIVADGFLAASNPFWVAAITIDAPLTRFMVNVALFAAGDVDSIGAGVAKVTVMFALAALATMAFKRGWRPSKSC